MVQILQVKTTFTGFSGAPGYNQLHFYTTAGADHGAQDAYTAAYTFWNNVVVQMSEGIAFDVSAEVKELVPATGVLDTIWNVTHTNQSNFASAGAYAGGAGAVVFWNTGFVRSGHRLRGKTFVVPLGGGSYQNNGTLATATVTALNTHSANLLAATADLVVWGRPSPTLGAGVSATASSYSLRDHVAILRSRRD